MLFLEQFIRFVLSRKKWWLAPVIITLLFLAAVIVVSHGSVVAPLIYAIF
jgi:hypothetical protein